MTAKNTKVCTMRTILKIAAREIRLMAGKPIYWFCMVAAPLFCYLFFTTLMSSGLPTDMPLGLVDNDRTATSRSLARNLNAFQMTDITAQYADVSEARRANGRNIRVLLYSRGNFAPGATAGNPNGVFLYELLLFGGRFVALPRHAYCFRTRLRGGIANRTLCQRCHRAAGNGLFATDRY